MSREIEVERSEKFEKLLARRPSLSGLVMTTLGNYGAWLGRNRLEFFTEYTDHGLDHVEDVVKLAYELIREECIEIITPEDVATLILSALLHDCAMHLTKDGFADLVRSDANNRIVSGFGDKPWPELYQDFVAESRRFSGRRLIEISGSPDPIDPPQLDSLETMNDRQRFLIGEFLRRHHHRLAHEIALYGVPGPTDDRLTLNTNEDTKHIADLAGLIARSHGLPMRSCLEYLPNNYFTTKDQSGIHTVFLMGLLRISDALQIQAKRASRQEDKVRRKRSPLSVDEWKMHQAIVDVNMKERPETVVVVAKPQDVKTYLKIKDLLSRIQSELDEAWTVIGEVYAYDRSFERLGFNIRRIRSNLDDEGAFGATVDYIPCSAAFEVADSDLLKLLIKPLYGNRPEIGIRELLQNSIDAVRELREYLEQNPNQGDIEFTEQKGDVIISIDQEEDGNWCVTVSDRGIGMTIDTVREYFLKAGASLRRSEIWRQAFEDAKGKSRVLRSGRFGIGALAAFLLGDKMYVSTRHVSAQRDSGVEFEAEIDTQAIELSKIKRPVGTTIRVQITDEVRAKLLRKRSQLDEISTDRWDWYCLEEPEVVRLVSHEELTQKYQLPPLKSELPADWHRVKHPDFRDIHWTYSRGKASELTCNGIRVEYTGNWLFQGRHLEVRSPSTSVFDFDSKLPLNLQRTHLTESNYPFNKVLLDDVLRDFIAFVLFDAPSQSLLKALNPQWYFSHHYPGIVRNSGGFGEYDIKISSWFSTPSGLSLADDPWHIGQVGARHAFLCDFLQDHIPSFARTDSNSRIIHIDPWPLAFRFEDSVMQEIGKQTVFGFSLFPRIGGQTSSPIHEAIQFAEKIYFALGRYEGPGGRSTRALGALESYTIPGQHVLVSRNGFDQILALEKQQDYLPERFLTSWQEFMSQIQKEWENDNWVILRSGDCPPLEGDLIDIAEQTPLDKDTGQYAILAKWYFGDNDQEIELSPLARLWKELIGSPVIPYDPEERRQKLARAYKELKPYIKAHEAATKRFEDIIVEHSGR
ncbi:ATP-binding protein [Candidatus Poribacteria bacterium]